MSQSVDWARPTDDRLAALERRMNSLEDENERLRKEVAEKDERISDLKETLSFTQSALWELEDTLIGDYDMSHPAVGDDSILDRIINLEEREVGSDELTDLRADLREEQKKRGSEDAKLMRRLSQIEDEVGISPDDMAGDRLTELIRNGPEAVTDRVYPVHHRARTLLDRGFDDETARDWCGRVNDSRGKRLVFKAPDVRPLLSSEEGTNLNARQVKRVFEKVEELAADSPRRVDASTTSDGVNILTVWVGEQ